MKKAKKLFALLLAPAMVVTLTAHGCSMALFLSAGLLEKAQREPLAGGAYAADTPAAIVCKATWPEKQVFRRAVGTLAAAHGIQNTALITVGCFLGAEYERSRLYDSAFSHGFREANP